MLFQLYKTGVLTVLSEAWWLMVRCGLSFEPLRQHETHWTDSSLSPLVIADVKTCLLLPHLTGGGQAVSITIEVDWFSLRLY